MTEPSAPPSPAVEHSSLPTVLIVDDHDLVGTSLAYSLSAEGLDARRAGAVCAWTASGANSARPRETDFRNTADFRNMAGLPLRPHRIVRVEQLSMTSARGTQVVANPSPVR